jgi:hypothetical protein
MHRDSHAKREALQTRRPRHEGVGPLACQNPIGFFRTSLCPVVPLSHLELSAFSILAFQLFPNLLTYAAQFLYRLSRQSRCGAASDWPALHAGRESCPRFRAFLGEKEVLPADRVGTRLLIYHLKNNA